MTKKKKINWALLGAVVGVCAAPFTGGTSLAMAGKVLVPTLIAAGGLGFVGGKVVGAALDDGGDDNDGIQQAQQNHNAQMEQWKALSEERRAELERLRQQEAEKEKQIKKNEEEIKSLESKLNDPNLSEEDKKKFKKRIIALQEDNRKIKGELATIKSQRERKEKDNPPMPTLSTPWKFPKLSAYDKALIATILVLIIYFLFLREDKKR